MSIYSTIVKWSLNITQDSYLFKTQIFDRCKDEIFLAFEKIPVYPSTALAISAVSGQNIYS